MKSYGPGQVDTPREVQNMEAASYLKLLLEELGREFAPIQRVKKFTTNPAVIGAQAEAAVRAFVRRHISPLKVSTGTILYEKNCGTSTPQLDTMLWWLGTAPPLFESGEFAIIPRGSCFGVLEIKRSMYPGSGE